VCTVYSRTKPRCEKSRLMRLYVCVRVCICVCGGGDGGQAFKGIAAALHRSLEHMNPAQVRELVESQ